MPQTCESYPGGPEITYYTEPEIAEKREVIAKAKEMWRQICLDNKAKYGDEGTCVLGAGLSVYVKAPRKRIPKPRMIIQAHEVSAAQGSCNWERNKQPVIDFLKANGLDAMYEPGWMD